MTVGGCALSVGLTGPAPLVATVDDRGNGTYTCSYTAIRAGEYKVNVTANGIPIGKSPFTATVVSTKLAFIYFYFNRLIIFLF